MRLITVNTWQGRIYRNLGAFFKNQSADIMCLQELNSSKEPIPVWEQLQTLETIKKASKHKYSYFSPTYSYDLMGGEAEFGNGILTNYPIASKQTIFTHGQYRKMTKNEYIDNTRNAQIVVLNTPIGDLTIVNHHGHWERDPMGSERSLNRLIKLISRLKTIRGPMIIAGDFNLWTNSIALERLKSDLNVKDLVEEFHITNTLSDLVTPFEVACDHIFVSHNIKVNDLVIESTLLSDHKAVILDFGIESE